MPNKDSRFVRVIRFLYYAGFSAIPCMFIILVFMYFEVICFDFFGFTFETTNRLKYFIRPVNTICVIMFLMPIVIKGIILDHTKRWEQIEKAAYLNKEDKTLNTKQRFKKIVSAYHLKVLPESSIVMLPMLLLSMLCIIVLLSRTYDNHKYLINYEKEQEQFITETSEVLDNSCFDRYDIQTHSSPTENITVLAYIDDTDGNEEAYVRLVYNFKVDKFTKVAYHVDYDINEDVESELIRIQDKLDLMNNNLSGFYDNYYVEEMKTCHVMTVRFTNQVIGNVNAGVLAGRDSVNYEKLNRFENNYYTVYRFMLDDKDNHKYISVACDNGD